MRGRQACSAVFVVMTESLFFQESLSLFNRSRGYIVASASTSSKGGDSRKGRTQELLDALTPAEKVTASESELEEAATRYVLCVSMHGLFHI